MHLRNRFYCKCTLRINVIYWSKQAKQIKNTYKDSFVWYQSNTKSLILNVTALLLPLLFLLLQWVSVYTEIFRLKLCSSLILKRKILFFLISPRIPLYNNHAKLDLLKCGQFLTTKKLTLNIELRCILSPTIICEMLQKFNQTPPPIN